MSADPPKSPKFAAARESLSADLRPIYDDIVADYSWITTKRHGKSYVAYGVLAELVQMGWRRGQSAGSELPPPHVGRRQS